MASRNISPAMISPQMKYSPDGSLRPRAACLAGIGDDREGVVAARRQAGTASSGACSSRAAMRAGQRGGVEAGRGFIDASLART